jgi:hypothetical protein
VGSSLSASYNRKQINCTKNFTHNAITNSSYLLCYRYHGEGEDVATGLDQIHHLLVGGALYVHPITPVLLKCNVPMNLVTQHVAGQNDRLLATSVLFVLEK